MIVEHSRPMVETPASAAVPRWFPALRWAVITFGILLGASQAWLTRHNIAADGISYLDMGSAFAQGNPGALINGYWSPLYPAAIGAALSIFQPSPENEFAIVHVVNFAMFLLAFASFEFFLRSVLAAVQENRWFVQLTGYVVFFWASLHLITVSVTSPDMTMAIFVFLATGFLVRIAGESVPRGTLFAGLGLALGLGYLAKAPMFPLSFVYLAIAAALAWKQHVLIKGIGLAAATFLAIAIPAIALLSFDKERLTFGDSGRLNYSWYVDGAAYRHWQGEPLGPRSQVAPQWTAGPVSTGTPVHATRKVLDSPAVFEFAGSTGGTYPVWYDPSYWNEGLKAPFNLGQQIKRIVTNAKIYYAELLNPHVVQHYQEGRAYRLFSLLLILAALALVVFGARPRISVAILPAVAALGMYLLVYAEPRHMAAFVAILYTGIFAAMRIPRTLRIENFALAIVLVYLITGGVEGAPSIAAAAASVVSPSAPTEDMQMADGLRQLGFGEGTHVGSLNYSNHDHVRWARIARATIVAERFPDAFTPSEDEFWSADEQTKSAVIDALAKAGADIVVSRRLPLADGAPSGWQRVGETRFYILKLGDKSNV